jgi:hypothetical protein
LIELGIHRPNPEFENEKPGVSSAGSQPHLLQGIRKEIKPKTSSAHKSGFDLSIIGKVNRDPLRNCENPGGGKCLGMQIQNGESQSGGWLRSQNMK